jgi:hypothetical protein
MATSSFMVVRLTNEPCIFTQIEQENTYGMFVIPEK